MSYVAIIIALKGGATSGNFGHKGRPGVIGGSQPGGGHGAIGATNITNLREHIATYRANRSAGAKTEPPLGKDTDFYNKDWLWANKLHDKPAQKLADTLGVDIDAAKALVGKAYSYHDEETGFSTIMDEFYIDANNGYIMAKGEIYSKDGDEVGIFERAFDTEGNVRHDLFQIKDTANQGSGFGSRFYQHSEDTYKQAGIKNVQLTANIDVGGYAWARMGFDFIGPYSRNEMNKAFQNAYKKKFDTEYNGPTMTAYEMAAFTAHDGSRFGKEVMLGKFWGGIKRLDDSDPGYQVGRAYYSAKKKGKK